MTVFLVILAVILLLVVDALILAGEDIVDLDEEKKEAMVRNLLVVLCADEPAQPVINSGTLNH